MTDERTELEDAASILSPDLASGFSRRHLFAAAGGFALAARGLLLPADLVEEAEADNHPVRRVQHRKEQRRRKRRQELQQRRDESEHEQPERPRSLGLRGIELRVANSLHPRIDVVFRKEGDLHSINERFIPAGQNFTFQTADQEGVLWIENRYFIGVHNPAVLWPRARMGYGGSYPGRYWIDGEVVINDRTMFEDGAAAVMDVDNRHFSVKRLTDSDYHIVFQVDVTG